MSKDVYMQLPSKKKLIEFNLSSIKSVEYNTNWKMNKLNLNTIRFNSTQIYLFD